MLKATGSCLCTAVQFSLDIKEKKFDVCHCSICRKWGGGPAFAVEAAGNIKFKGESNIAIYKSSQWAERGFCKQCGSHLFYRLKEKNFYNFNLGTLDKHEDYSFVTQIFIDSKPDNYTFLNKTKNMTEKEVLECHSE